MCVSIWYLSFSFWLTSLCMISSRFIYLIRTDSNVFPFMAEDIYIIHHVYVPQLLYPWGFPDSSVGKESACNAGDSGSIPESGRSPGGGIGYSLQYSRASLVTQLIKNPCAMWKPGFDPWVGKSPWRRDRLPTPVFWPREFHGLWNSIRSQRDRTERLLVSLSLFFIICQWTSRLLLCSSYCK